MQRTRRKQIEAAALAVSEMSLADPDVEDALAFGDRLHLRVRSTEGVLNRLPPTLESAGVTVSRMRSIPPTLEDAFISLLAKQS